MTVLGDVDQDVEGDFSVFNSIVKPSNLLLLKLAIAEFTDFGYLQ